MNISKLLALGKFFLSLVAIFLLFSGHNLLQAQTAGDLALNKPIISVSSTASGSNPSNAVDGNPATYWTSSGGGAQWLGIDLGVSTYVGTVGVKWGTDSATNYNIELSEDGSSYAIVRSGLTGDFNSIVNRSGRYILIRTTAGTNPGQYQLGTLEVYAGTPPVITPTPTPTPTLTPTSVPIPTSTPAPIFTPTPTPFAPGDANRDRKIDLKDLSVMMSNFNKTQDLPQGSDLNGDNKIDKADYDLMVKLLIDNNIAHPKK